MHFSTAATVAFAALSSVVHGLAAPGPQETGQPPVSGASNPITSPLGDVAVEAGKPFPIKWYDAPWCSMMRGACLCLSIYVGADETRDAVRHGVVQHASPVSPTACQLPGLTRLCV